MSIDTTSVATSAAAGSEQAAVDSATLSGTALVVARAIWIALTLTLLGLDVIGLPFAYQQLLTGCPTHAACAASLQGQLTAEQLLLLPSVGLSAPAYASFFVALQSLTTLVFVLVGTVIFVRQSANRVALLGAFALVCFGATFGGTRFGGTMAALPALSPAWIVPVGLARMLSDVFLPSFLLLFPSGRWVPRWAPVVVAVIFVQAFAQEFFPNAPISQPQLAGALLFIAEVLILLGALMYRYRAVSTWEERQKTKWVVFGAGIGVAGFIVLIAPIDAILGQRIEASPEGNLIANALVFLFINFIPLSIAIAILRSHLFDIDVIINRALVYGLLTALLAAVYFVCVIGAQALIQALTGQTNIPPVVIVASTLLIAALFTPLRHRLQTTIDRRFYRRKYDATRTLAAFGAKLRTETDLTHLSQHLVSVVNETMQPTHVSLWLRPMPRETMQ